MNVQRGDVILTRVPHAAGGHGKKRPAVVVQADVYNRS
jgi:mRNA-degrading endonuclease toxin of MazEF toxin-antitoxin module